MRAGMQCLLDLLRDARELGSITESEWPALVKLADEENLLPWLAARLSLASAQLPSSIGAQVAAIRREAQHKAFVWSATLKQMLAEFNRRGIQAISLKGPWLGERLYGDASLRSYNDLDFLVLPSDWTAVEHMLLESGFSPSGPACNRHSAWRRGGILIDVHLKLENPYDFSWDKEGLWSRARLSQFHGVPGWLLSPADELQFLCLHAVLHCFECMSLLVDLNMVFRQLPRQEDRVCMEAGPELRNVVVLSSMLVSRLEGAAPVLTQRSSAPAARLEKRAACVWKRCMRRAGGPTWQAQRELFIEMQNPEYGRLQRLIRFGGMLFRVAFAFSIEADYAFAARLHLHRKWQVRMLRPIRLLIDQGPSMLPAKYFLPPISQVTKLIRFSDRKEQIHEASNASPQNQSPDHKPGCGTACPDLEPLPYRSSAAQLRDDLQRLYAMPRGHLRSGL